MLQHSDSAEAEVSAKVGQVPYVEPLKNSADPAVAEPAVTSAENAVEKKAYYLSPWFRAVEVFVASTLLVAFSPLMIITYLLLKLQGLGSVIYKQERVGLNGQSFTIYKFRTMFENAEKEGPFICTTYSDSRITPLGAKLRKSKIDELPQLWNVMVGSMSLIGPRPERPCFHQEFSTIENWPKRVEVKPGITGLAQISAVISHDPEQKIVADLAYINNRSFLSDIFILVITVVPSLRPKFMFEVPIS